MSNSLVPLKTVLVRDPTTNVDSKNAYAILLSSAQNTYTPNTSSSYSNSQIQFSPTIPSVETIVDRHMWIKYTARVTLTVATGSTGPNVYTPGLEAPRAFPLHAVTNTLAIQFNGSSINVQASDIIPYIARYNKYLEDDDVWFGSFPAVLDESQAYSDLTGGTKSPLATYASTIPGSNSRGSFPVTVVSNTSQGAVLDIEVTEPVFLSPLLFTLKREEAGFVGLNQLIINYNLSGDRSRWWSRSTDAIQATVDVDFTTVPPVLLIKFLTPQLLQPVRDMTSYSFTEFQRYPTAYGNVTAGSSFQVTSNNIQLQFIPQMMLVFARRSNDDADFTTTDTFAYCTNLSVNFNNQSGQLASATAQDLYLMSVKNGCKLSWPEWRSNVGSPVGIMFGRDLGLNSGLSPGLPGQYNLQVTAQFTNISSETINYSMYILTLQEGVFNLSQTQAVPQLGVFTQADVLDSKHMDYVDYEDLRAVSGGNFLDSLKKFVKNIPTYYEHAKPVIDTAIKVAKDYGPALAPLLLAAAGEDKEGGRRARSKKKGGNMISATELKEIIRNS